MITTTAIALPPPMSNVSANIISPLGLLSLWKRESGNSLFFSLVTESSDKGLSGPAIAEAYGHLPIDRRRRLLCCPIVKNRRAVFSRNGVLHDNMLRTVSLRIINIEHRAAG